MTELPFELPSPDDVRLVVTDMDGTLLDADKRVPADFWPLLDLMHHRGIVFVPASGRQYATLARTFTGDLDGMTVIAENGAYVVRDGHELASTPLDRRMAMAMVEAARRVAADGRDVGTVLCGKRSAYVERTDPAFLAHSEPYYAALERVTDLTAADDEILKVAVFDFGNAAEVVAPALEAVLGEPGRAPGEAQVVVSGEHWTDVMAPRVSKGDAVERLQAELGVGPDQTVAFGDYLNDLTMLDAAAWSFAVAGAHPLVRERARYLAPANTDHGVVRVLQQLFAGSDR